MVNHELRAKEPQEGPLIIPSEVPFVRRIIVQKGEVRDLQDFQIAFVEPVVTSRMVRDDPLLVCRDRIRQIHSESHGI